MKLLNFQHKQIEVDSENYLQHIDDWSIELANYLASLEDIVLTDEHWLIINFVRKFYFDFATTPGVRLLVRALEKEYGKEIANSVYLQQLFPQGVAKQASKFAGLKKPKKCL